MVTLGFTGTAQGMTLRQLELFETFIRGNGKPDVFHHGDCVGADAQAHDIVRRLAPQCWIVIHPCTHTGARAFKRGHETREPLAPLKRNRVIVAESGHMVATPATAVEILRSGTWATVRYARQADKPLVIIYP